MAIAPVAHVAAGSTNNASVTTGAIDTSGASLIVLIAGSSASTAPSDSKGNAYTLIRNQNSNLEYGGQSDFYYCLNPIVGSGHTFSLSDTSPVIAAAAFSGVATSSALDQQSGANSQTAGGQPGSITPSVDNALVVTAIAAYVTGASPTVSGYTLLDNVAGIPNQNWGVALAYNVQGAATATNPVWASAGSDMFGCVVASFKPAAGGGGGAFNAAWARGANTILQPGAMR